MFLLDLFGLQFCIICNSDSKIHLNNVIFRYYLVSRVIIYKAFSFKGYNI